MKSIEPVKDLWLNLTTPVESFRLKNGTVVSSESYNNLPTPILNEYAEQVGVPQTFSKEAKASEVYDNVRRKTNPTALESLLDVGKGLAESYISRTAVLWGLSKALPRGTNPMARIGAAATAFALTGAGRRYFKGEKADFKQIPQNIGESALFMYSPMAYYAMNGIRGLMRDMKPVGSMDEILKKKGLSYEDVIKGMDFEQIERFSRDGGIELDNYRDVVHNALMKDENLRSKFGITQEDITNQERLDSDIRNENAKKLPHSLINYVAIPMAFTKMYLKSFGAVDNLIGKSISKFYDGGYRDVGKVFQYLMGEWEPVNGKNTIVDPKIFKPKTPQEFEDAVKFQFKNYKPQLTGLKQVGTVAGLGILAEKILEANDPRISARYKYNQVKDDLYVPDEHKEELREKADAERLRDIAPFVRSFSSDADGRAFLAREYLKDPKNFAENMERLQNDLYQKSKKGKHKPVPVFRGFSDYMNEGRSKLKKDVLEYVDNYDFTDVEDNLP